MTDAKQMVAQAFEVEVDSVPDEQAMEIFLTMINREDKEIGLAFKSGENISVYFVRADDAMELASAIVEAAAKAKGGYAC